MSPCVPRLPGLLPPCPGQRLCASVAGGPLPFFRQAPGMSFSMTTPPCSGAALMSGRPHRGFFLASEPAAQTEP